MPFGNIGAGELILILIIALVIFGPGKLPEIGQAIGRGIREFRKAASDVTEASRIDAPPVEPPAGSPPSPAPPAAPGATNDEDARRQYEELKARFERSAPVGVAPTSGDESHGDADQSSS